MVNRCDCCHKPFWDSEPIEVDDGTMLCETCFDRDYKELPHICPTCNGSGETVSGAPGGCYRCKGRGELRYEPDPYNDPRIDWEKEER